jgi:hypothetical protein
MSNDYCSLVQIAAKNGQSLDSRTKPEIYHQRVGTLVKVIVGLLIILAVTTILVTPDPSDDVMGVVHPHNAVHAQLVFLSLIHDVPLLTGSLVVRENEPQAIHPTDVVDLVCARLC